MQPCIAVRPQGRFAIHQGVGETAVTAGTLPADPRAEVVVVDHVAALWRREVHRTADRALRSGIIDELPLTDVEQRIGQQLESRNIGTRGRRAGSAVDEKIAREQAL